jgi:hypothetical protein
VLLEAHDGGFRPLAEGSAVGRLSRPEPPPQPNDQPAVWDLVLADMRERDAEGRRKYGVPLQPDNGRRALVDAYQEGLDLVVYLRQEIEERTRTVTSERHACALEIADALGWGDTREPAWPSIVAAVRTLAQRDALLHSTGRCECAGQGDCYWCTTVLACGHERGECPGCFQEGSP